MISFLVSGRQRKSAPELVYASRDIDSGTDAECHFFKGQERGKYGIFLSLPFGFRIIWIFGAVKKEGRIYSRTDFCFGQDTLVLYQGGFLCRFPESVPSTNVSCSPSFFGKDISVHISYVLYSVSIRNKGDCGNSGDRCPLMKIFLF